MFTSRSSRQIGRLAVPSAAVASLLALAIVSLPNTSAQAQEVGYFNQRFVQPSWVKPVNTAQKKQPAKIGKYLRSRSKLAKRKSSNSIKVAALGKDAFVMPTPKTPVTGSGVRWVAAASCLNNSLTTVIYQIANAFGPVTVNSTCRSRGHNRRVGGARRSHHLTGDAVDFRVHGSARGVYAFLRSSGLVGGLKHYGGGLFHIDSGDRRSW